MTDHLWFFSFWKPFIWAFVRSKGSLRKLNHAPRADFRSLSGTAGRFCAVNPRMTLAILLVKWGSHAYPNVIHIISLTLFTNIHQLSNVRICLCVVVNTFQTKVVIRCNLKCFSDTVLVFLFCSYLCRTRAITLNWAVRLDKHWSNSQYTSAGLLFIGSACHNHQIN